MESGIECAIKGGLVIGQNMHDLGVLLLPIFFTVRIIAERGHTGHEEGGQERYEVDKAFEHGDWLYGIATTLMAASRQS
ncbi:hypothetical protein PSDVSF_25020 [Pseudodesulfovibrio sediminis]|uniref:Uncharacterized protein n=1 Tax=Pseudodesulfovibrio sediminis TaxID=2810563 RepID=A0ABM7P7D5_9BACT|nr:hypothetical protein PSDVSF_25020 [Pseudodesulfovibrio sediminis]